MDNAIYEIISFLKDLFLLRYLPDLGNSASYGLLFLFGIMTSFHCLAMCGGIAICQTVGGVKEKNKNLDTDGHKVLLPSFLYNLGRVISYTIVGGILGGIGGIVGFTGVFKGTVPIVGGIFMIIMAINLFGVLPFLRRFNVRIPMTFAKKIRNGKNYSPIIVGLMSGLMPCGPLQIVELYALGTKSALLGALSIFFFSLGTVPMLFFFGIVNSYVNKNHSAKITKASAVLVLILGFVMIGRGLSLFGVSVDTQALSNSKIKSSVATISGGFQTVTVELEKSSYEAITVQKGILVKWTIKADKDKLNECNNAITIPKLKIEKSLSEGDNLIEFTPSESGEITYTCWMGMINSKIIVVDEIKK